VSFFLISPAQWLPVSLYLSWGLILVAAIVTLFFPHSWHDFLWLGIAILSGVQLLAMSRTLAQIQPPSSQQPSSQQLSPLAVAEKFEETRHHDSEQVLADLRLRHHVAYDRYDALGQSLTALNIQLQTALKLWETDPHQAHAFLSVAHEQGITAMQEIRRSIALLEVEVDSEDASVNV
jgi:signal transduction histidine kinase